MMLGQFERIAQIHLAARFTDKKTTLGLNGNRDGSFTGIAAQCTGRNREGRRVGSRHDVGSACLLGWAFRARVFGR